MPARTSPLALLVLSLAACSSAATRSPSAASLPTSRIVVVAPTEPRDLTADEQVHHVLDRLAFGARPGDLARVRAMGVDQWIGLQLAPDQIDDRAMEPVLASYETLTRPTTELVSMYTQQQRAIREQGKRLAAQGDSGGKKDARAELLKQNPQLRDAIRQSQRLVGDVQSARLARAVGSDRQLEEVMTDFWENHFTVFAGKGLTRLFIPAYDRDVIRPRALGHFRDLLGAVAKSPAMLFYLDQWQSTADSLHPTLAGRGPLDGSKLTPAQRRRLDSLTPAQRQQLVARVAQAGRAKGLNENYARELLELHTLGVDGGYTQHDVIEVARALTGWTMAPQQDAGFVFRPAIHDAGQKVVLGHVLPAGRGIEDGEEVLDILARDPRTAHFIARKLAVRFVSDAPPAALVERAARAYLETDGDIREVVRTIVTSPEFFSRSAYRSKVKSPFELVASALRAVGAAPDTTARSAQLVGFLGEPIFGHQAPNGWPETGESWMNTGAILNRINFGMALAAGRLPGASVAQWSEGEKLRSAPREQQVDAVITAFLGGRASPDTREILLNGENPMAAKLAASTDTTVAMLSMADSPRMDAAAARRAAPGKNGLPRPGVQQALARPAQLSGLAQVVGLAIGAPEFQRR